MRNLFNIDLKDYSESDKLFIRPSVRGIIIKNHKVALVYSKKYDYYKFPGGGINNSESKIDCLIREVKEEVGLVVLKDTIKEYGFVLRKQKLDYDVLYQENYYYLCDVSDKIESQNLDDYENDEEFTLEFVDATTAIDKNNNNSNLSRIYKTMVERDAKVLELLIEEGMVK